MCWKEKEKHNTLGKKETASLCRSHKNVFIMMMLMVFVICPTGTCSVLQLDPFTRGLCCHAGFCSGQMSDVYTCLAWRFDPFLSSHCVNIMTHFFSSHLPTVQFDGAEWDRSSSPTERLRAPGPRSSPLAGGGIKFRMPQEGLSMVGERVDPTLPLEKQVYVCSRLLKL